MSWIYMIITLIVCVYRTNFYDLCCAIGCFYFLNFVLEMKKWAMWLLLLAILIAYLVDGLWFFAHLLPWW